VNQVLLYSGFLYFPEDKSAYIPALIEFSILLVLCIATFLAIKKISKRQEMKTKELEEKILNEQKRQSENQINSHS